MTRVWIPVPVVAKQRARLGRRRRAYTPERTVHFENAIKAAYQAADGGFHSDVPVGVEVDIEKDGFWIEVFELEQSVRPVGITGDIDNYQKSIFDGLHDVAYENDRKIEYVKVQFVGIPRKPKVVKNGRPTVVDSGERSDSVGDSELGTEIRDPHPAPAVADSE